MENITDTSAFGDQKGKPEEINMAKLFRLPWTMADNALSWLEPTRKCNITCDACFATNDPESQKSLPQIEAELQTLLRLRRCDAMLIAGGEPLTHPQIVEITRMVKTHKVKPVILTNAVGLNKSLVQELKKAGAHGFTLHVDSHQNRPGWEGADEEKLNDLRQQLADTLHGVGSLTCAFNTTIFPDTLDQIPAIVRWAIQNIDRVTVLTLIAVRMISPHTPFDFYIGDTRVDLREMGYHSDVDYRNIEAWEMLQQVRKVAPDFQLCAYLGGTALPHAPKWTIGNHVGISGKTFGNLGAKSMELLQNGHHLFTGSYLAYTKPALNRKGKSLVLFSLFDPELRKTFKRFFKAVFKNPSLLSKRLYTQSINILQPPDILPHGEEDNCDGCPNKTPWEGTLVSACRLDDYKYFGGPLRPVPKQRTQPLSLESRRTE
jgi:hypothetical protein